MRVVAPIPIQMPCSSLLRGRVLTDWPPYWTMRICTTMVKTRMSKKRKLLKKPLKELYSYSPNLRELISLKICMNTKELKIRVNNFILPSLVNC